MRGAWYTKLDLVYHLLWPAMTCLLFPVAVLAAWGFFLLHLWQAEGSSGSFVPAALLTYIIAFLPGLMITLYYRSRSRDISLPRTVWLAHLMPLYQLIWLIAGWKAVGRITSRKNGWAKTARIATAPVELFAEPDRMDDIGPMAAKARYGIPLIFLAFLAVSILQALIAPAGRTIRRAA